jgi:hypothetical protein
MHGEVKPDLYWELLEFIENDVSKEHGLVIGKGVFEVLKPYFNWDVDEGWLDYDIEDVRSTWVIGTEIALSTSRYLDQHRAGTKEINYLPPDTAPKPLNYRKKEML